MARHRIIVLTLWILRIRGHSDIVHCSWLILIANSLSQTSKNQGQWQIWIEWCGLVLSHVDAGKACRERSGDWRFEERIQAFETDLTLQLYAIVACFGIMQSSDVCCEYCSSNLICGMKCWSKKLDFLWMFLYRQCPWELSELEAKQPYIR